MMSGDRKNFDMQSNCSAEVVSDNPNDLLGRIGRQSSSDHQKIKHGQAALLFGDAIHRNEVEIMREIIPSLDLMVVMELLQGNSYDLERSLDAALALMASLAAEDGRAVLTDSYSVTGNNWKEPITSTSQASLRMNRHSTKEDFLPPTPYRARSSSSLPSVLDLEPGIRPNAKNVAKESGSSSSVFVKDHEVNINHTFTRNINPHILQNSKQNLKEFRGVPMLLSERFLAAPRFRIVINKHTNASTDFTIYFRRKTEKIGITIQELDSEIRIHTLHAKSPSEPLLALESGIKINDILTGINFEYFCPGAEVQDIIDILHLTGTFITLHFSRRYIPDDIQVQSYLSPHHKFARMLLDQTVIPEGKASIVSTAVRRLKERSLSWDSNVISQRIKAWKLDAFLIPKHKASGTLTFDRTSHSNSGVTVPGSGSSVGSSSSGSSHSRTSRRASGDFPVRTHTDTSSSTDPVCLLRPAISVRIIRAEERPDHVVYVIWVMDVRSGAEWFVRRRFREFHDFKDVSSCILFFILVSTISLCKIFLFLFFLSFDILYTHEDRM